MNSARKANAAATTDQVMLKTGPPRKQPRNASFMSRGRALFFGVVAISAVLAAVAAMIVVHLEHAWNANYRGNGTSYIAVQIRQGDTIGTLAARLVSLGVIEAVRPFVDAADASSDPSALRPGYVRLRRRMNATAAYTMLTSQASRIMLSVDIPPGWPIPKVLSALSAATAYPVSQFVNAVKDTKALGLPASAGSNPEGYLFPGIYRIQPDDSPIAFLQGMIERYGETARKDEVAATLKDSSQLEERLITIASLIQAESGTTSYYPMISRVIYNRLEGKLNLDLDSTVAYALRAYGRQPTQQERGIQSPYNTYLHGGLPPGPIDSPSAAAIRAALHPATGDWTTMTRNPATGDIQFSGPPSHTPAGPPWWIAVPILWPF
jgi:UPF0755 protein